jgi:hypothetical protein
MKRSTQHFRTKKTTTVATLLKEWLIKILWLILSLETQRILSISKNSVFLKHVNGLIKNFFNDSASQFASFLPMRQICQKGIGRLKKIVDSAIQKKEKWSTLIKSTISLCVLLAMYHLVLEKIHQFNRFYLLFVIFIHDSVYHFWSDSKPQSANSKTNKIEEETIAICAITTNYWLISIWSIYT